MPFLPAGLYAPSASAALWGAASENAKEQLGLASLAAPEAGIKSGMSVTAYAPAEKKKIALYSRVG